MSICEETLLIGGQGGNPFNCTGGTNGKVLEEISVWVGNWQIKAIKVTLSGGLTQTFGMQRGPVWTFKFMEGERFSDLTLWGNGKGKRVGKFEFHTTTGRLFSIQMSNWDKVNKKKSVRAYPVNVGSGICVGVVGRSGDDIDLMGFQFLKKNRSSKLKSVNYPDLALDTLGIPPETLDTFASKNTTNEPLTWKFSGSQETTSTSTWSISGGIERYVEENLEVEASFLKVFKVKGGEKYGWKTSVESTHSSKVSKKLTLSWDEEGTLKPGESISLIALTRKGEISTSYSGTMEINLVSGETFSYPVSGMYKGLSFTGVEITDK